MPSGYGRQPSVVRRALVQGNIHYPLPDPAPLSPLSLDGRQGGMRVVSPISPASSVSSSLPRTLSSDGVCSMQRPSTASSAPTSFRSPVSTQASSFKHGWHRPAVARPKTTETPPSPRVHASKPDEMGYRQRPSTTAGASIQPTAPRTIIQDERSMPVVLTGDPPPAKIKRNRLSQLFQSIKRPSTSSSVAVDKEKTNRGITLAFWSSRTRTLSLQPTTASHLNGNHSGLMQPPNSHSSDHHQRRASLVKATISPPVPSTAVWQSQTGRQCLPITASPLLNSAISIEPEPQERERQQQRCEESPLDTLVNDASVRHGRPIGNDEAAFDINSISPNDQASLLISPSPPPPLSTLTGTMQHDGGAGFQPTQGGEQERGVDASVTGFGDISASQPHGHRKQRASLHLARIETRTSQSTTSSSYIEIFSTPDESPVEDSFEARVSPATPTLVPRLLSTTSKEKDLSSNAAFSSFPTVRAASSSQPASSAKPQRGCLPTTTASQLSTPEWALPTQAQLAHAAFLPIYQSDGTPVQFGTLFAEHRAIVLFLRHFFCPLCQDYVSSLSSLVKHPILMETGALCDFNEEDARTPLDELENEGLLPKQVQLVLISCGKPKLVEKYKHMFGLPFRMFTDPELKVYEALGMGKMGDRSVNGGGEGGGDRAAEASAGAASVAREDHVQGTHHREWHDGEVERSQSAAGSSGPSSSGSSSMATNSEAKGRQGGYVKHGLMGGIAMVLMRAMKAGMPIWENGGNIAQLGGEFVLGPGLTCTFAHRMQNAKGHAPVLDVLSAANVQIPEEALNAPGPSAPRKSAKPHPKSQEPSAKGKENASGSTHRGTNSLSLDGGEGGRTSSLDTRYGKQTPDSHTMVGHGVPLAPNRRKRESFVTATLRSMGDNVPARFKGITPHTIGEDAKSVVSEITAQDHDEPYHRAKGFYADTEFVSYSGSPPPRPGSHLDREQSWMEFREKDLDTLRRRKDERRRTGQISSVAGSLITGAGPVSPTKLFGMSDQRYSLHASQEGTGESVSVDLSQLEFRPGSTEHLEPKAHALFESSTTSTTRSFVKRPTVPTFKDDVDDLDDIDLSAFGVVSVGGFIQVPKSRNTPNGKRSGGGRISGAGGSGKLPKSVQAAIDPDLKMGSDSVSNGHAVGSRKMQTKSGREGSLSASARNLFRSS